MMLILNIRLLFGVFFHTIYCDIMKLRYILLPMIIISLMIWIIDNDKDCLVNKEIISNNIEISYPFFDNVKIDSNDKTKITNFNVTLKNQEIKRHLQ